MARNHQSQVLLRDPGGQEDAEGGGGAEEEDGRGDGGMGRGSGGRFGQEPGGS